MYSDDAYLGCPCEGVRQLRALNDKLNAKMVEQVNDTQELLMLNKFARESNESQFKKCLQERISDIASWRWVLEDLTKRLEEAVNALQYEPNALRVVVERIQDEVDRHSREGSRPGAFCPMTDAVEDAIMEEFKFLREHKKKFEKMIPELETQINALKKTKKRIDADIILKKQAICVEESCACINVNSSLKLGATKKRKKRASPVTRWLNRCASLKAAGLRALSNAAIARQQVRGARTHISIACQAYGARVDSALRRRLHSNNIKLQDLKWQREEALKDYQSLGEELSVTEQNLIQTLEQERVIEARLRDRSLRPPGELTKDEVDRKLRDELGRLRCFSNQLRINMKRINSLQNHLADSMTRIDCCGEDLFKVICLDEERIRSRLGEIPECTCHSSGLKTPSYFSSTDLPANSSKNESTTTALQSRKPAEPLTSIIEENEDDYPFES